MTHKPQFSVDWTSHHLPDWTRWLSRFAGQPVRGLEIGSFEGRSAVWFFEHILTHAQSTLICIDPWDYEEEQAIVPGGATHIAQQFCWETVRNRFRSNLEPWRNRMIIMPFTSGVALPLVPRHPSLAFAYVDGSHTAAAALSDAVQLWPYLGSGSVLIWDDYGWTQNKPAPGWDNELLRPKLGVDRFLEVFGNQYDELEFSNQQVKIVKR
jgi:hypothetical protein